MEQSVTLYQRHRFTPEIISHAVWLYYRFSVSYRDVEEMLAQRGINVSYEAIRYWCRKFGPAFARSIRQRQRDVSDQWHVDEGSSRLRGGFITCFEPSIKMGESWTS